MSQRIEINMEELKTLLERAKIGPLSESDYHKLKAALETLGYLTQLLEDRQTTIQRLRQILFGASTEKLHTVLKPETQTKENLPSATSLAEREREESGKRNQGHGRNGASAYRGATQIKVKHNLLQSGDRCPQCQKGKVYDSIEPGWLIRIVGQAPIAATVYELEKLRCNLCGEVFTAPQPPGIGPEKYDASSASMMARGTTGMLRARAATTSGLSLVTAVEITTASASPSCSCACP